MGRFFSDAVEQAIQYIYCDLRAGKGQEGMRLLEELDFPQELIVNSAPDRLAAFFRERAIEL